MNLSEHFTVAEMIYSQTASERQINNAVPEAMLGNLKTLAEGLERVRELLNAPLHINSGYRCAALNEAVGGSKTSAHMEGFAVGDCEGNRAVWNQVRPVHPRGAMGAYLV